MSRYLPYGRQDIGQEEMRRVREVLESDWFTQGPRPLEFEVGLAAKCGAAHAVAMTNGTMALHLACRAAGLGPGDKFITTPITFVATANAAVLCGAEPVFVDIDPVTWCLDPDRVEDACARDGDIKVILPMHLGGRVSGLPRLHEIAARHGVTIIEDACHAMGGRWYDQHGTRYTVGDGSHAAMTCFSFHPVKSMTTGEGGAVTTNDQALADKLERLREHGITRDPEHMEANDGSWYYEMRELGWNARMSDIQAALGLVQLQKLERLRRRRMELVQRYDDAFADLSEITTQARPVDDESCWHLMLIRTPYRAALREHLQQANIGSQVHYIPVHLQPYYRENFGTGPGDCPAAEKYYAEALSLPLFPTMTDEDQQRVIEAVTVFNRDLLPVPEPVAEHD